MSDTHERRVSEHPKSELLLFVVDETSPAQRAVVTEHLAICAECQASLRELRETFLDLDAQPMASMSELEWQRALGAATSPRTAPSVARASWRFSSGAVAGLVAAVFLVAAVLALSVSGARQGREVERLRVELRETRALAVVAMLREPESAERLRGVALGEPLLGHDARV